MKDDHFNEQLQQAADQLRDARTGDDLRDFERGVWAEIALHDERMLTRLARFFREGLPAVPVPAVTGSLVAAMLLGIASALFQANAYGESRAAAMEERYVASIHPVLRSESNEHRHLE